MRALVTGGTGGIGQALIPALVTAGHEVFFTFHANAAQAARIHDQTGAVGVQYDQGSRESLERLAATIPEKDVSLLVNLAAPRPVRRTLLKCDTDTVTGYLADGVRGPLALSRELARHAAAAGTEGAIVNVLTMYVLGMPPEQLGPYVAMKSALLGLTRSMAVEFARYGVRVNAVSPAMTRTAFLDDLPERFIELAEERMPLKRLATAHEVAAAIGFLLSPGAAYITGANIPVTGGQAC